MPYSPVCGSNGWSSVDTRSYKSQGFVQHTTYVSSEDDEIMAEYSILGCGMLDHSSPSLSHNRTPYADFEHRNSK